MSELSDHINIMGQLHISSDWLNERNDLVMQQNKGDVVVALFSTTFPDLEIDGITRRYSSDAARVLGGLLVRPLGVFDRTEIAEDIATRTNITLPSARQAVSMGLNALRRVTQKSHIGIVVQQASSISLREDLFFAPTSMPKKNTPRPRQLVKPSFTWPQGLRKMHGARLSTNWQQQAGCIDVPTAVFYPEPNHNKQKSSADISKAKNICAGCVVKNECLQYAIKTKQEYGIWGGKTETERKSLA